nr:hypothetical protein GCM10020185_30470 [Pseudomonas brassicacearum subsp. brassicacearum]
MDGVVRQFFSYCSRGSVRYPPARASFATLGAGINVGFIAMRLTADGCISTISPCGTTLGTTATGSDGLAASREDNPQPANATSKVTAKPWAAGRIKGSGRDMG